MLTKIWKLSLVLSCFILEHAVFSFGNTGNTSLIELRNVIVEFDPYVSPLDAMNPRRYKLNDLMPLISTVSKRFNKIYVRLDFKNYDILKPHSTFYVPLAVAKHNCVQTTQRKIEVYLSIEHNNALCNCFFNKALMENVTLMANNINNECNGTVSTILFQGYHCSEQNYVAKCFQTIYFDPKYTWGLTVSHEHLCKQKLIPNSMINPAVIVLTYYNQSNVTKNLSDCSFYNESFKKLNTNIIKLFDVSDTGVDRIVNMSRMINTWRHILKNKKFSYIISKAFDSYHWSFETSSVKIDTSGWWYLENDSFNVSTSEYVFTEKISVAQNIDHVENPRNFEWLQKEKMLNKSLFGVIHTGKIPRHILYNDFCRLLFLEEEMVNTTQILALVNSSNYVELHPNCQQGVQFIVPMPQDSNSAMKILQQGKKFLTVLVPSDEENIIIEKYKQLGIRYGYSFTIYTCDRYSRYDQDTKDLIHSTIRDPDSVLFLFHFEDNKALVELGATRLFRYRKALFESCKYMVFQNRPTKTEIIFSMSRYYKLNTFYQSAWAMQNYVKYVYLLQDWALKSNNVSIFIGDQTDGEYFQTYYDNWASVGWFSMDESIGQYVKTQKLALDISNLHYPQPSNNIGSESSVGLFLVAIIVLLFFGILAVFSATYYLRRYYNSYKLNKEDIYFFLNGMPGHISDENKLLCVPYDKKKHEITDENFKVFKNIPLGSGEFGEVCRGILICKGIETEVAVKTNISQKYHKSVFKQLLSEIKLMAYIESHENIVQFLGANTSLLKEGKIYIFLELCELGSLENVLREMRSNVKNGELCCSNKLNHSTSKDLHQWSCDICKGMLYLAEKNVVHADLAARNVLLSSQRQAKISDFGLSRRMYNYTMYLKRGQEPLPWKWMAPESLRCQEFSEKSDVWAFGITLWEMYSLGTIPYPGLSWEVNFIRKIEKGFRLSEPTYNENGMYELMRMCWELLPHERPSFAQLISLLNGKRELEVGCNGTVSSNV